MSHLGRAGFSLVAITMALTAGAQTAHAQAVAPNPYATVPGVWGQLPEARAWGSTSAVYPSPDGNAIWVGERCGENILPTLYSSTRTPVPVSRECFTS